MKLRLLLFTFLFSALSWGQLTEGFETGLPTAYTAVTSYTLSSGTWTGQANGVIRGTTGVNSGSYSCQLRSQTGAQITSPNITSGVSTVTFYGSSSTTSGSVQVNYSTDGGSTWNAATGSPFSLTTGTPALKTATINSASPNILIQFYRTAATVYIDDITINYFTPSTYNVTYNGNGNTGGSVPTDSNNYASGASVTVLGNTGSLVKTGFTFNGWNTASNGSGTHYNPGNTFNITANTTLYAEWLNTSPPVITSLLTASGIQGSAFTYNIIATNTPTSYNATSLPAGLSINTSTGQITGTPTGTGTFNVSISATNAYGTDTQTLVITITTGPCLSQSSFTATPSGWLANSVTYASGEAVFGSNNGDLATVVVSNPASLTFDLRRTSNVNAKDMIIEVSTTSQTGPFTSVFTYNHSNTTSASTTSCTVDLSAYTASTTVYIRFRKASATTSPWYLTNVAVFCGTPLNNEIDVLGNGVSIVDGDITPSVTDDTDFGTTLVGVDVSHTFTITNAGPDDLTISGVTISGVDAADFYVSIAPGTTITAGNSTTFEITFNSSTVGISNATINIANNDSDENPYTFDITGEVINCTPTTSVTSITPTSGPVGTVVTVNGSGFTTATSVHFGSYTATFSVISDSVIEAIVPANATTGNIIIQDAGSCDLSYSLFTVIVQDNSTCDPTAVGITDLFISEVTDASSGSLSYIQIFNGTGATVDMTNYEIRIRNNGSGTGDDIPLTGTLVSGGTFVLATSVGTACAVPGGDGTYADQNDVSSGVNNNDCIHLAKLGSVIDTWGVCNGSSWINALGLGSQGYDFKRKPTATPIPSTTFVDTDWTIVDFNACSDNYDLINAYEGIKTPPSATTLGATYGVGCTSATVSVTGTEAVAGGAGLTYQWYFSAPGDTGWTMVSNGGIYSGATTDTLNISNITGVENYQYYCQVMEDTATCFIASAAVQIGGGASTTWNGSSWSNGVPNSGTLAIINGNYDTSINGSFSCCSLLVNATYTLDIQAIDYVEIQYNLTVNGTLNVLDDGSLVQVDDSGVNTGNINYQRITTGVNFDYVYWSSPVNGVNTPSTGYIYTWDADFANPNNGWGYWILSRNTPMAPGVGYIMRNIFSRTFTGVPRNGVIQPSISRANYTGADFIGLNGVTITNKDDNWNLVGNPYPSAISALDFLTLNTNIEGAVRIWTHGTSPSTSISDPVYDNYQYNYTVNDYIVYNGTGTVSGPAGFNGFIAGGQSFMINMNDGAATTEMVTFNNSMRNRTHNNEQFYRQSSSENKSLNSDEKHRIWLDLANSNNNSTRTLVGYVSNATNNKDRLYDAVTNAQSNEMGIYSVINNERMLIQGRKLPFDDQDKVQLAVNIPSAGIYSIGLSALDGLFTGSQDIYLEDKDLNIIHDLKIMPYSFSASVGEFKNRFVLRYTNQTLNIEDIVSENDLIIGTLQNGFTIKSNNQDIKAVTVYNVLGQVVFQKSGINSNEVTVSELIKNNQALILKISFDNNKEVIKKVLF